VIVCDTGLFVAYANAADVNNSVASKFFDEVATTGETIALTPMVLAEVCYWLNKVGGPAVEAAFLDEIAHRTYRLLELDPEDVANISVLVRKFASFPLGGTDAAVAVAADRYRTSRIATFDRRHFPSLQPKDSGYFELLP
jgi:predicted nucleic acid-binding protein